MSFPICNMLLAMGPDKEKVSLSTALVEVSSHRDNPFPSHRSIRLFVIHIQILLEGDTTYTEWKGEREWMGRKMLSCGQ